VLLLALLLVLLLQGSLLRQGTQQVLLQQGMLLGLLLLGTRPLLQRGMLLGLRR
jgi:hypothetical protein